MEDFLAETVVLLILGAGITIAVWLYRFYCFAVKNRTKIFDTIRVLKKKVLLHKKYALYTLAVVAVVFVAAIFWWQYAVAQKHELTCLKVIEYRTTYYIIRYKDVAGDFRILKEGGITRKFKTQDEAMRYCLKVIRP